MCKTESRVPRTKYWNGSRLLKKDTKLGGRLGSELDVKLCIIISKLFGGTIPYDIIYTISHKYFLNVLKLRQFFVSNFSA